MKTTVRKLNPRKGTKKNNVVLREKELSSGNLSLYLDIYRDGVRTYEFLKLYVNPKTRNPLERETNRQTFELAEKIRTQRESELNHLAFGEVAPGMKKINFLDYFQTYIDTYTKADKRMIKASFVRFKSFLAEQYPQYKSNIKPDQITKNMMVKFVEYLESLSTGEGALTFYKRFKKVIKYAVEENVISKNPCNGVVCRVDENALKKDILSIDEMKILLETFYDGQNPELRRAFIFTLYTGIRHCDIINLKYSNVDYSNKLLMFEQSKTKGKSSGSWVNIPLNEGLLSLIGEKPAKDDYIFKLPSQSMCLRALKTWTSKAKIDKNITWHSGRHSFAVNILNNGANIKTVASLLGHSGLKHTEKYTRAVDSLKEQAINSLPKLKL